MTDTLNDLQWTRQPEAESLLRTWVDAFLAQSPTAALLAHRMKAETGTRFFDWIDTLTLPASSNAEPHLLQAGFALLRTEDTLQLYTHPNGMFPRVALSADKETRLALKVDSVPDFLATHTLPLAIDGEPFAPMRTATIARHGNTALDIIERRGNDSLTPPAIRPAKALAAARFLEAFRRRRRHFPDDDQGFAHANNLLDAAIAELGQHHACALFFQAEREYWQRRNRAAQVQKARQDRLGLGWANHDHHTYRSSRHCFHLLIALWEKLGFVCRERFYAGREAGWGAQIMENPVAGIITFNDVDLSPEEVAHDFAHTPLPPSQAGAALGTVGLWCALHGEAFLQAGMHHLECQFDFAALQSQLAQYQIATMKPFTDFPHLKQAFTEGERWSVAEDRIAALLAKNLIIPDQAQQFRTQGAIGSHLENLERNEGYKGFNQKGISEIITATDPRLHPNP
jgi:hypothetical protein